MEKFIRQLRLVTWAFLSAALKNKDQAIISKYLGGHHVFRSILFNLPL